MSFGTRFAPSPTGLLHLGHAFSALTAFQAAQAAGGRFLLRIEDTDITRCRPMFEAAIYEDLAWLGVVWETPVWRQSERMDVYAAALDELKARGLVYRCFRTRRSLMEEMAAPHGPATQVVRAGPLPADEEASLLASGAPFAWRLWLDAALDALGGKALTFEADGAVTVADPERLGDIVLARKEFPASYHLASVIDDAAQGITHVIRGEDLIEAAHIHVLLQALLGLPTPIYRHHRLILGADGKRLAKRDHAATLASLRADGVAPDAVCARLGL
jgi:glutamyl-Q tRNA(Asp) synthetase